MDDILKNQTLWIPVHGRSRYAKLSIHDGLKVKIAPVHSDFECGLRRCH